MDSDRQLHAQIVGALDAVTPPARWLASSVRGALSSRRRAAKPPWSLRGLTVAVAMGLIVLLGAGAIAVVVQRSQAHPAPAHTGRADEVRYAALLTSDKQLLDEAAGREVRVGSIIFGDECDGGYARAGCAARVSAQEGAYQRLLADLDRTTPPARFAAEHARMRAALQRL